MLGKIAKGLIDAGNFVDDSIVISMIENEIEQHPHVKGFLFDGFPRTTSQAEALDALLSKRGTAVHKVISFIIDDNKVFERIHHRATIEGRHDDAKPEVIQNRIDTYHKKTEPLIKYYKDCNKYHEIDGTGQRVCRAERRKAGCAGGTGGQKPFRWTETATDDRQSTGGTSGHPDPG